MPPIEIGLLPTQRDSFNRHEELSKLLKETDVFYLPHRNNVNERNLPFDTDRSDLTKPLGDDLSNRHWIVTFRDLGYSLFLDSVQCLRNEEQSKIDVSGKMIVDGICVQFFGYFYCDVKDQPFSENKSTQISGVGRVELDENYYRELSSNQIKTVETNVKNEQETFVGSTSATTLRSQKGKTKERKTSQNHVIKSQTTTTRNTSEENISRTTTNSPPSTSLRSHSYVHKPYPPRSPRSLNKPLVNSDSNCKEPANVVSSLSESSSSLPSHFSSVLNTPSFSTSTNIPTPIPVLINPTAPAVPFQRFISPMALPQAAGVPAYVLPGTTIAYITNFQAPLANSEFSSASNNNGPMLFIVDPGQSAPSQPVHLVTPLDYRSLPFGAFLPRTTYFPSSSTSNIFHSMNRPSELVQTPVMGLIRQNADQLPLKKRRYPEHSTETNQIRDGDGETSGDSSKK